MTERVLPLADGASACPFVAFEDDRDERATVPDHRHRCYAEPRPAPRALAHQEAYCLSSAFPVCPIFQDWARREAARARADTARADTARNDAAGASGAAAVSAAVSAAGAAGSAAAASGAAPGDAGAVLGAGGTPDDDPDRALHERRSDDDAGRDDDPRRGSDMDRGGEAIHRNPPRDWAAPPPWLASRDARPAADAEPPGFLGQRSADPGRGLAGSAADRLAGGPPPADEDDAPWTASASSAAAGRAALGGVGAGAAAGAAGAEVGGAVGRPRNASEPEIEDLDVDDEDEEEPRRPVRRPRAYGQHLGGTVGPDWERPRRQDAYPTIKTRVGLPHVPRIALMAGLVALLAVALYFLPAVLGIGSGGGSPRADSPGPSSAAQKTPAPSLTEPPAPTPGVYTIKKGDTLSKVAKAHGITIEELLAANPTIKNADKISEGQQIILPVPSEAPPTEIGGSPEPSAP